MMSEVANDVADAVAFLEGGDVGEPAAVDNDAAMRSEAVELLEGGAAKIPAKEPEAGDDDDGQDDLEDDLDEPESPNLDDDEESEEDGEEPDEEDAEDEDQEKDEEGDDHGKKVKKGKARKMRERAQAAEQRVAEFEEHFPKLVENAEWFANEYTKASNELSALQAENARLAERLEKYEIPEFDSDADRRAYELERKLRQYEAAERQKVDATREAQQRAMQERVAPIAQEIKSMAAKSGLNPVDIAEAFAFRAKSDPNVTVKAVVKNLVAASGKAKKVAAGRRQAEVNGRAPSKPKGGSAGVSDVKQYPNTTDGAVQFLLDKGY